MSLKTCLRVVPQLLKQFDSGSVLIHNNSIFTKTCVLSTPNLTKSLQLRHLFNDASKTEVETGRQRVYYGILTPQIRAVKWFSLTTSAIGLMAQPIIVKQLSTLQSIPLIIAVCSFVGFFTFGTPFLLHFVTKKYITHLDYNPSKETYIASTVNFFCMLKQLEFKPDDVKVPDVPGMFTTFVAKDKPMFLDPRLFEDPSHYAKIMGYDKPIDFKMFESPPEEVKKQ